MTVTDVVSGLSVAEVIIIKIGVLIITIITLYQFIKFKNQKP
jgi:hypothetical protein